MVSRAFVTSAAFVASAAHGALYNQRMMKSSFAKRLTAVLALLLATCALAFVVGCGSNAPADDQSDATPAQEQKSSNAANEGSGYNDGYKDGYSDGYQDGYNDASGSGSENASASDGDAGDASADSANNANNTSSDNDNASTQTAAIDENGSYTSKDEVALYIHTYGHLPSNYISKSKAKKAGWVAKKGNLDEVCPGMSIGGSEFYNDEGLLPDKNGRTWTECDINYKGGHRGAERIVFSNDGLIFYTDDHYETFEQLY